MRRSGGGWARSLPVWAMCLVVLSACDALVTPTPSPTPGRVDQGSVLEFDPYTSPRGYSLAVPVRATRTEQPDGSARFVVEDGAGPFGMFSIDMVVSPAAGLDPSALIARVVPPGEAVTTAERLEPGTRFGIARSYAVQGSSRCPEARTYEAAAVIADVGYLLRIASDAPGRCDAANLPETPAIVESFRTVP